MGKLQDETGRALRIRGLWELLPSGDGVREAVDSDVHSALARVEGGPRLPHLVPSPYCLSREPLQQQKRPAAQRRRHHQPTLFVLERLHHRMQVPQTCGDWYWFSGCPRPLTPRVGMRAVRKEQLQPRPTVRDLLDTPARRLHAVTLRVIDDAPPLRDLIVIRLRDPHAPLGDEPLDQFLRLSPPGTRDGSIAIGRPRLHKLRRLITVSNHRVVVDHQEATIPHRSGRTPAA